MTRFRHRMMDDGPHGADFFRVYYFGDGYGCSWPYGESTGDGSCSEDLVGDGSGCGWGTGWGVAVLPSEYLDSEDP